MGQACGNLSADSDAWIPERAAIYDPIRENSNRLAAFVLSLSLFSIYLSICLRLLFPVFSRSILAIVNQPYLQGGRQVLENCDNSVDWLTSPWFTLRRGLIRWNSNKEGVVLELLSELPIFSFISRIFMEWVELMDRVEKKVP